MFPGVANARDPPWRRTTRNVFAAWEIPIVVLVVAAARDSVSAKAVGVDPEQRHLVLFAPNHGAYFQ